MWYKQNHSKNSIAKLRCSKWNTKDSLIPRGSKEIIEKQNEKSKYIYNCHWWNTSSWATLRKSGILDFKISQLILKYPDYRSNLENWMLTIMDSSPFQPGILIAKLLLNWFSWFHKGFPENGFHVSCLI